MKIDWLCVYVWLNISQRGNFCVNEVDVRSSKDEFIPLKKEWRRESVVKGRYYLDTFNILLVKNSIQISLKDPKPFLIPSSSEVLITSMRIKEKWMN